MKCNKLFAGPLAFNRITDWQHRPHIDSADQCTHCCQNTFPVHDELVVLFEFGLFYVAIIVPADLYDCWAWITDDVDKHCRYTGTLCLHLD